jgi:hypothetical protein
VFHEDCIKHCCWLLLASLCLQSSLRIASAQSATDAVIVQPVELHTLPADTEIHLRLLESVASNTHKRGDRFKLEVAEPVLINSQEVIPSGCAAEGEVIHSAKAGMAGKPGELILAARLLQLGEQQIKLRSFSAATGQNRYNLANGLSITLVIPGLFVVGKNISIPSGTDVYAKVAAAHSLPATTTHIQPEAPQHEPDGPDQNTGDSPQ